MKAQLISAAGAGGLVVGGCAALGAISAASIGDVQHGWALFWVMTTAWGVAGAALGEPPQERAA